MGDSLRIQVSNIIGQVIKEENLLEKTTNTGAYLLEELKKIENEMGRIHSSRGRGGMLAFNVDKDINPLKFCSDMR